MYLIHYAFSNLIRNKGRNIMISIIILAMVMLSGVSMILNTGASQIVDFYKAQFGSKVTLHGSMNAEKITPEVLLSFCESSYLHLYKYTAKVAMKSSSLMALGEAEGTVKLPKFYLKASSLEDESFKQKIKILIKGKMPSQVDEVIISKELAELNRLYVGSKIALQSSDNKENKTYTIVGIYEDLSLKNKTETIPLMNPSNEIYTNYKSFIKSDIFQKQGELDGVFYLKKPSDLNSFQKEIKAKGLPLGYEAKTDIKGYEETTAPANSIRQISTMFVIGIITVGSILLLLITAFSIRERKYEIGVLRAIGMSRVCIVKTLIWETLMLCGSCLVTGILMANILGPILGNELLLKQKNIAQSLANISFSLNMDMIIMLCLITLTTGLITSIFGILFIVRFEPRKILSERN